jgi:hypothetical protein
MKVKTPAVFAAGGFYFWLKKDAIIKLETVSRGDLLITQAIKNIQKSLADGLWLDASHIIFFQKACNAQTDLDADKIDPEKFFGSGATNGLGKNCSWPKSGLKVFGEEYLAVKLLQKIITAKPKLSDTNKEIINQAIDELVRADLLLAKVAISEAKNTIVQNPKLQQAVKNQILNAEENFAKTAAFVGTQPDKAILNLVISWFRAQIAIKLSGL